MAEAHTSRVNNSSSVQSSPQMKKIGYQVLTKDGIITDVASIVKKYGRDFFLQCYKEQMKLKLPNTTYYQQIAHKIQNLGLVFILVPTDDEQIFNEGCKLCFDHTLDSTEREGLSSSLSELILFWKDLFEASELVSPIIVTLRHRVRNDEAVYSDTSCKERKNLLRKIRKNIRTHPDCIYPNQWIVHSFNQDGAKMSYICVPNHSYCSVRALTLCFHKACENTCLSVTEI